MRLWALLLIATLVIAGAVHACAGVLSGHADPRCDDDCCQPVYAVNSDGAAVALFPICERLATHGGCPDVAPLARAYFQPPRSV